MPGRKKNSLANNCVSPVLSGLYTPRKPLPLSLSRTVSTLNLRLDVDGRYPQYLISISAGKKKGHNAVVLIPVSRRAKVVFRGHVTNKWGGRVPFGNTVTARCKKKSSDGKQTLFLYLTDTGNKRFRIEMVKVSPYFRSVVCESDRVSGIRGITSVNPVAHAVHHTSLPDTTLHLTDAFKAAGIDVRISSRHSVIPRKFSGKDQAWNRRELHDAMQTYWSQYSRVPQWSMWVLFADQYAESFGVGGLMFDTRRKHQRRGVALFNDTMFFNPPPGITGRASWKKRMKFFTVCHELGHLFNLAHSREKADGTAWLPRKNNPSADSFMNQPHFYDGGCEAFFRNFTYRFDDEELCFMRHAPEEFVQMGHGTWFENHALSLNPDQWSNIISLNVRTKRPSNRYRYMEPVTIEMKLMNNSGAYQKIDCTEESLTDKAVLRIRDLQKDRSMVLQPFSRSDFVYEEHVCAPGDTLYGSLFISADTTGWIITDPGSYELQALLTVNGEPVVSNVCRITVSRPPSRHLEVLAQDYFSEDVGRVLAFDGSRVLDKANTVLYRLSEPDIPQCIGIHACIALAIPQQTDSKKIVFNAAGTRITPPEVFSVKGDTDNARKMLYNVLLEKSTESVLTLGNVNYKRCADLFTDNLLETGCIPEALSVQKKLYKVLLDRGVKRPEVLEKVTKKITSLENKNVLDKK